MKVRELIAGAVVLCAAHTPAAAEHKIYALIECDKGGRTCFVAFGPATVSTLAECEQFRVLMSRAGHIVHCASKTSQTWEPVGR